MADTRRTLGSRPDAARTGDTVSEQRAFEQLQDRLEKLCRLNPDLADIERTELRGLASRVHPRHFPEIGALTQKVIDAYLNSSAKRMERDILREYFELFDNSSRLLAAGPAQRTWKPVATQSMALVLPYLFTPLERIKIVSAAGVPRDLMLAVDACRRHNQLVSSVVEHAFGILQAVDAEQSLEWQLGYLERNKGKLDPDVVRDLLKSWLVVNPDQLPRRALEWAESWSADDGLGEQWPGVIEHADRLLRRCALRRWDHVRTDRSRNSTHLRMLVRRQLHDEAPFRRWLDASLIDLGQSVQFFVSLNQQSAKAAEQDEAWRAATLFREIRTVEALFTPILLMADLILARPDGAYRFGLAFFGLVGQGREQWNRSLLLGAEKAVRLAFLRALKEDRTPEQIIRKLTFGDRDVQRRLLGELDWLSKRFDSMKQRDLVVRRLAVYYASYREALLLAAEVARRYRDLMRVLHEDNLRRVLTAEQFEAVGRLSLLRDLAALVSDARRFLARRRALKTTVEEMLAAELEFVEAVRRRRLVLIRQLLEA
jgi:hypothetical protein